MTDDDLKVNRDDIAESAVGSPDVDLLSSDFALGAEPNIAQYADSYAELNDTKTSITPNNLPTNVTNTKPSVTPSTKPSATTHTKPRPVSNIDPNNALNTELNTEPNIELNTEPNTKPTIKSNATSVTKPTVESIKTTESASKSTLMVKGNETTVEIPLDAHTNDVAASTTGIAVTTTIPEKTGKTTKNTDTATVIVTTQTVAVTKSAHETATAKLTTVKPTTPKPTTAQLSKVKPTGTCIGSETTIKPDHSPSTTPQYSCQSQQCSHFNDPRTGTIVRAFYNFDKLPHHDLKDPRTAIRMSINEEAMKNNYNALIASIVKFPLFNPAEPKRILDYIDKLAIEGKEYLSKRNTDVYRDFMKLISEKKASVADITKFSKAMQESREIITNHAEETKRRLRQLTNVHGDNSALLEKITKALRDSIGPQYNNMILVKDMIAAYEEQVETIKSNFDNVMKAVKKDLKMR